MDKAKVQDRKIGGPKIPLCKTRIVRKMASKGISYKVIIRDWRFLNQLTTRL